jgi:hypothetical protein
MDLESTFGIGHAMALVATSARIAADPDRSVSEDAVALAPFFLPAVVISCPAGGFLLEMMFLTGEGSRCGL